MKFLRLNVNDNYNNNMGGCDIADQLHNCYHFDHWMRKCKWWWSFFFWAIGVLLVNTFVAYKASMHQKGKVPMSHYQFRKAIALAWIDPAMYWPNRMKRRDGGENSTNNSTTTGTTTGTTANSTMGRSTSTESRGNVTLRSRTASEWMASSTSIGEYCSHKKKAAEVNDNSLCPRTGTYKNRLSISQGGHTLQQSDAKRPQCALHLWSNKTKV